MIRFAKRLIGFAAMHCGCAGAGPLRPYALGPDFGGGNTQWISERFSETLREKNELVVYEVEITGQETVSQDAWLLGTVQKVEMPYTFQMSFTVDLSQAVVSAGEGLVEVRLPSPSPAYPRLTVQENEVKKSDWLYPLTPERYAQIQQETEERLFAQCSENEEYRAGAWGVTVRQCGIVIPVCAGAKRMGEWMQHPCRPGRQPAPRGR